MQRALIVIVCLGLIVAGLLRSFEVRNPDRPAGTWRQIEALRERDDLNLIVILVDTLRADRMSAYGYERPTTPVLEALAESGVRFENVLAQSTWTKSSMASMLTATYPVKNRITRFDHGLPEGATLASEILKRAGFHTVGLWRNGWVSPNFGFDQGFDIYLKPPPTPMESAGNPSAAGLLGTDRSLIDSAIQFAKSNADRRFYLYLHMMDVHQYVYGDGVDFGSSYSDIYDKSVHFVDSHIGTFIAALQEIGLMKKTVIAVVSDHGEAFLEHGTEGHARNLYDETTRVPFLLLLPFRLEEPIVVQTPVENVDVFPTLLDLVGLPGLPEADGESSLPLVLSAAREEEGEAPLESGEARYAHLDTHWGRMSMDPLPLVLVHEGRYRLHQSALGPPELYDYVSDPGEQRDVVQEHVETARELQRKIAAWLETPAPSWGLPTNVTIPEMEIQQLRALGYVVDPLAPREKRRLERK